jgi:acetolactate synthase-1/2/3 large subunit
MFAPPPGGPARDSFNHRVSPRCSQAIGHHMVSGRPQALMMHVDAGTLNLGCQLHNTQRNRTPVVVFAGRAPYTTDPQVRGHRDNFIHWQQEQLDQQAVMRACGKWHLEVESGSHCSDTMQVTGAS